MSRVFNTIEIERPIEAVFAYVTTPGHWPEWHPATLGVRGATDHSAAVGEHITEDIRVAGFRGVAQWTVREREEPWRWVIEGTVRGSGGGILTYQLTPTPTGTHFERKFTYSMAHAVLRLVDALLIRPRIVTESAVALARLKHRLEG